MREHVDFHHVEAAHFKIDGRLRNWSRVISVRSVSWTHPMWRGFRPNECFDHETPVPADPLDGMKLEKAVSHLPEHPRDALRWAYVFRAHPMRFCRQLGVTPAALGALVRDGRQMLINRGV
ncbi:hypothetical protein UFOVP73_38 [uncultured Caudovirales phage]|uniref:Uncharacterized protein n=1 Tax=uncultured Caudovirales phage TaxID=2100421 RepID=A0A6J7WJJ1_9CAUD|nr:hypothetical protein UFOVP73_38 [uncultured Caudovirales phage]CAB5195181.1 hypothetical protein UFOVP170_60 [uncultured Caudovirales phage]